MVLNFIVLHTDQKTGTYTYTHTLSVRLSIYLFIYYYVYLSLYHTHTHTHTPDLLSCVFSCNLLIFTGKSPKFGFPLDQTEKKYRKNKKKKKKKLQDVEGWNTWKFPVWARYFLFWKRLPKEVINTEKKKKEREKERKI